jgi:hypothetical protein
MNRRGFLASLAGLVVGPPVAAAALRSVPKSAPRDQAYFARALEELKNHLQLAHVPRQLSVMIEGELPPEHEEFAKRTLLDAVARERELFGPCWMFCQQLPQPVGVDRTYIEYIGQPAIPMRYVRAFAAPDAWSAPAWLHRFDVAFWFEPIRAKIGDTIHIRKPARYIAT